MDYFMKLQNLYESFVSHQWFGACQTARVTWFQQASLRHNCFETFRNFNIWSDCYICICTRFN